MTAISLGRFLRGVAIPSDFGSIFTTAVDMPRIMTQSEPRPHSEIGANFRGTRLAPAHVSPLPPSSRVLTFLVLLCGLLSASPRLRVKFAASLVPPLPG